MPFFENEYVPYPGSGRRYINNQGTLENLLKDKTKIENEEFYDCWDLIHAEIPEGITELGRNAFFNCMNLETVTLPKTLKKIGRAAFAECNFLESIEIPEGVEVLEKSTFERCHNLRTVILPESLKEIESNVFENCYRLQNILFKNCSVKFEDTDRFPAFWSCHNLKEVHVLAGQKITKEFKSHFNYDVTFVPYEPQESLSKSQTTQIKSQDGRDGK